MKTLIILLTITSLSAISPKQIQTAKLVRHEACKYTRWSDEVVAICGTETSYGEDRKNHEETYGLMQISPATAKWIAVKHKHLRYLTRLSDTCIKYILISNDRLSIELASRILDFLIEHNGYDTGIRRYNGVWNHEYLVKVNKNCKYIRKILKEVR